MDPARAGALRAALGMDGGAPDTGAELPPLFHQIYFWAPATADALGEDGHARSGLLPDMGGAQRMWAGGKLVFHAPLRAGVAARRVSTLKEMTHKTGRSGPLTFVTLRHDILQRGEPVVTEDQMLVYRDGSWTPGPPGAQPRRAELSTPVSFPESLLFRFSALTFNAHRIHYDADYCRDIAGYPGLVVHGPLMALFLALLGDERSRSGLAAFSYRAHAPLFAGEPARICAAGQDLWLEGPGGRLYMTAAATPRS